MTEDDIGELASRMLAVRCEAPMMLTDAEAAKLLNLGRTKFRQMVDSGRAPEPIRFGRAVRWAKSEIASWIHAGCPAREKWETMKKQLEKTGMRQ